MAEGEKADLIGEMVAAPNGTSLAARGVAAQMAIVAGHGTGALRARTEVVPGSGAVATIRVDVCRAFHVAKAASKNRAGMRNLRKMLQSQMGAVAAVLCRGKMEREIARATATVRGDRCLRTRRCC